MKEHPLVPVDGHLTYVYYEIDKVKSILKKKTISVDDMSYLKTFMIQVLEEPVLTLKLMAVVTMILRTIAEMVSKKVTTSMLIIVSNRYSINPLFIHILRNKYRVVDISPNRLHLHSKIIQDVYNSVTVK